MNLFFPLNGNSIPGQINASNILVPFPNKRIKKVEGYNEIRNYTNVTLVDPIIAPVANEYYHLFITITKFVANPVTGYLEGIYSIEGSPDMSLLNISTPQTTFPGIVSILCDTFDASVVLPGLTDRTSIALSGYKLLVEDIT